MKNPLFACLAVALIAFSGCAKRNNSPIEGLPIPDEVSPQVAKKTDPKTNVRITIPKWEIENLPENPLYPNDNKEKLLSLENKTFEASAAQLDVVRRRGENSAILELKLTGGDYRIRLVLENGAEAEGVLAQMKSRDVRIDCHLSKESTSYSGTCESHNIMYWVWD